MSSTPSTAHNPAGTLTKGHKKVIFASSLGTVFEWYDFFLYGSLAAIIAKQFFSCLLYTSPSPRDQRGSRMPSSA